MFGLMRIIVGCLFFLCANYTILKPQRNTKYKKCAILIVFVVIFVILMSFFPLENIFVTFDSPESAYKYYNSFNSNVELVVNGEQSDLVVGGKDDSDIYLIVPKTNNGWKIGVGVETKQVAQKNVDNIAIYVYQYKNTTDYFLTVCNLQGGPSQITDVYATEFVSLERNNLALNRTLVTYYGNIPNLDEHYQININGKNIYVLG